MRLSVKVVVDYAHRLLYYKGKCNNLHGHTAIIYVEVEGQPSEEGIIVDFNYIKDTIKKHLDHKTLLNKNDPLVKCLPNDHVVLFDGDPTVENIIKLIRDVLRDVNVMKIKVREGSGGAIVWKKD